MTFDNAPYFRLYLFIEKNIIAQLRAAGRAQSCMYGWNKRSRKRRGDRDLRRGSEKKTEDPSGSTTGSFEKTEPSLPQVCNSLVDCVTIAK